MFSFDEYAETHKHQIIMGRKTGSQLVEYILTSMPSKIVPLTLINPSIHQNFIKNISYIPSASRIGFSPECSICKLIRIENTSQYSDYIENLCSWIYVLIEMTTGEIDSNCSKLALDLYVYRGISESDFLKKGVEYNIYINYIKLLNETP